MKSCPPRVADASTQTGAKETEEQAGDIHWLVAAKNQGFIPYALQKLGFWSLILFIGALLVIGMERQYTRSPEPYRCQVQDAPRCTTCGRSGTRDQAVAELANLWWVASKDSKIEQDELDVIVTSKKLHAIRKEEMDKVAANLNARFRMDKAYVAMKVFGLPWLTRFFNTTLYRKATGVVGQPWLISVLNTTYYREATGMVRDIFLWDFEIEAKHIDCAAEVARWKTGHVAYLIAEFLYLETGAAQRLEILGATLWGWCCTNSWLAFALAVGLLGMRVLRWYSGALLSYRWLAMDAVALALLSHPFWEGFRNFSGEYCTVAALMFKRLLPVLLYAKFFKSLVDLCSSLVGLGQAMLFTKQRAQLARQVIMAFLEFSLCGFLQMAVGVWLGALQRRLPFLTVKMQLMLGSQ